MLKKHYCTAVIILNFFTSVSLAATQSFYAYGSNDDAMYPTTLSQRNIKNYPPDSNWTNISAHLWLRSLDDYYSRHCSASDEVSTSCNDNSNMGHDSPEIALITIIVVRTPQFGINTPVEFDNFKWYDLNINVASYLSNTDTKFSASIKAAGGDFWDKNAKLAVGFDIKAVPAPAVIWVFGSALLGLTGIKRKSVAKQVAA